jgi:hypothetical protein
MIGQARRPTVDLLLDPFAFDIFDTATQMPCQHGRRLYTT